MYIQPLSTTNYRTAKSTMQSQKSSKVSHPNFSSRAINYGDIFKEGANLAGQNLWKAKKVGACLVGAILCRANCEKSDFEGAMFNRANLTNANFTDAKLSGAHFVDAITNNTDFMCTNLVGAEFKGDKFGPWTNLLQANVCRANFEDADLEHGMNLANAFYDMYTKFPRGFDPDYFNMKLIERGADFSNISSDLNRSKLRCTIFDDVNFENSSLKRVDFRSSRFNNCNMHHTDWTRAYAKAAEFHNCDLSNSKLNGLNLDDAELDSVDLSNSDLRGANLNWHAVRDIKLEGAKYDKNTIFKEGFEPYRYGMQFETREFEYDY